MGVGVVTLNLRILADHCRKEGVTALADRIDTLATDLSLHERVLRQGLCPHNNIGGNVFLCETVSSYFFCYDCGLRIEGDS